MDDDVAVRLSCQRQRLRRRLAQWQTFIQAPATGSLVAPATARLTAFAVTPCADGASAAVIVGTTTRTLRVPALDTGDGWCIGVIEADATVTVSAGFTLAVQFFGRTHTVLEASP